MSHPSFKVANKMSVSSIRREIKGLRVLITHLTKTYPDSDHKFYKVRLLELEQALKKKVAVIQ